MRPIILCVLYMKEDPFTDTASYNPVRLIVRNIRYITKPYAKIISSENTFILSLQVCNASYEAVRNLKIDFR